MSGLHADRGWLLLSLQVPGPGAQPHRWRHYLKLRDTRENRRRAPTWGGRSGWVEDVPLELHPL